MLRRLSSVEWYCLLRLVRRVGVATANGTRRISEDDDGREYSYKESGTLSKESRY